MRLFLLYAVIEVIALVAAVTWIGFGWTLLLMLGGLLVGMWLVRREGARATWALAEAARAGRMAHAELTDGALIGLAGLLILVPGVVSDVLGLLLVLPPTRALARNWLVGAAERRAPVLRDPQFRPGHMGSGNSAGHMVVDGEVVTEQPEKPAGPPTPRRAVEN